MGGVTWVPSSRRWSFWLGWCSMFFRGWLLLLAFLRSLSWRWWIWGSARRRLQGSGFKFEVPFCSCYKIINLNNWIQMRMEIIKGGSISSTSSHSIRSNCKIYRMHWSNRCTWNSLPMRTHTSACLHWKQARGGISISSLSRRHNSSRTLHLACKNCRISWSSNCIFDKVSISSILLN